MAIGCVLARDVAAEIRCGLASLAVNTIAFHTVLGLEDQPVADFAGMAGRAILFVSLRQVVRVLLEGGENILVACLADLGIHIGHWLSGRGLMRLRGRVARR